MQCRECGRAGVRGRVCVVRCACACVLCAKSNFSSERALEGGVHRLGRRERERERERERAKHQWGALQTTLNNLDESTRVSTRLVSSGLSFPLACPGQRSASCQVVKF